MDQTQGMAVAALIDWFRLIVLASFCEHLVPLACLSEQTRVVHVDLVYASVMIISLVERIGNSFFSPCD